MDIDKLVDDLTKPLFLYRMAKAMVPHVGDVPKNRSAASAPVRMENARKEIERIVREAVSDG
jgi:hypothetical protein